MSPIKALLAAPGAWAPQLGAGRPGRWTRIQGWLLQGPDTRPRASAGPCAHYSAPLPAGKQVGALQGFRRAPPSGAGLGAVTWRGVQFPRPARAPPRPQAPSPPPRPPPAESAEPEQSTVRARDRPPPPSCRGCRAVARTPARCVAFSGQLCGRLDSSGSDSEDSSAGGSRDTMDLSFMAAQVRGRLPLAPRAAKFEQVQGHGLALPSRAGRAGRGQARRWRPAAIRVPVLCPELA